MAIDLTLTDLELLQQKIGKTRSAQIFSLLGRHLKHFNVVIGTEIGSVLLEADISRFTELFDKIYEEKEDDSERAEFRVLRRRLKVLTDKIHQYLDVTKQVKEIASK